MVVHVYIIVSKRKFTNSVSTIPHVKLIIFLFAVLGRVIVIIPLVRLGKQQASSLSNVSDHATRLKRSGLAAVFTDKKDELVKAIKDESVLYIFLSPELASSHLLDLLLDLPSADNDRFTHIFVDESHCVVKWLVFSAIFFITAISVQSRLMKSILFGHLSFH